MKEIYHDEEFASTTDIEFGFARSRVFLVIAENTVTVGWKVVLDSQHKEVCSTALTYVNQLC